MPAFPRVLHVWPWLALKAMHSLPARRYAEHELLVLQLQLQPPQQLLKAKRFPRVQQKQRRSVAPKRLPVSRMFSTARPAAGWIRISF